MQVVWGSEDDQLSTPVRPSPSAGYSTEHDLTQSSSRCPQGDDSHIKQHLASFDEPPRQLIEPILILLFLLQ
jgi:hypothetical protein